jgi:hypothetical protein
MVCHRDWHWPWHDQVTGPGTLLLLALEVSGPGDGHYQWQLEIKAGPESYTAPTATNRNGVLIVFFFELTTA